MRGLKGKRVLISGGTSGIGLATARRFLEEDARVFVAGRDQDKIDRAVADLAPVGEIAGMSCDVSREDEAVALVEAASVARSSSSTAASWLSCSVPISAA